VVTASRLEDRLSAARDRLVVAGSSPAEAALEVDLFARTILGWDRARVLTSRADAVPPGLEPQFSAWIGRRAEREPSAYITGLKEFWGLDFRVTPDVLIPRPETELIVEEALCVLAGRRQGPIRLADVGTGSGCLAVSLTHELPAAAVTATDVSGSALRVARENASRHGVDSRITFVQTSGLDDVGGVFDLIAANPPYVKDGDRAGLPKDVQHEPDVALFGGPFGLRGVEIVLDAASRVLRPGGWLVMEFGFGQEEDVRRLTAAHATLRVHHVRLDLQGIPRTAVIERTRS
jgi:release factor glutamine methyltransferase